jgi:hypothetical protein
MNWSLFYQLNQVWIDTLLLGLIYFIMFSFLLLSIKFLANSLKDEEGNQ